MSNDSNGVEDVPVDVDGQRHHPPPASAAQASSSSSKEAKPQQQQSQQSYWPGVRIVYLPEGKYSPQTDEWCFTYCSQSARGRAMAQEPYCRSICLRKVFAHEVAAKPSKSSHDANTKDASHPYPLPPEGQPKSAIVDGSIRNPPSKDVQHWEEGWYLWASKSRWAVQEKYDLMMASLDRQTWWQRNKEKTEKAWREEKREAGAKKGKGGKKADMEKDNDSVNADYNALLKKNLAVPDELSPGFEDGRPFPDPVKESLLIRLPPPIPIQKYMDNLFVPTSKVLGTLNTAYSNGGLQRLGSRLWETSVSDKPFLLARNAMKRAWNSWNNGPPDSGSGTGV